MKTLQVEISEDLAKDLEKKDQQYLGQLLSVGFKQMKMEEALQFLKNGHASIGYVAAYAGVSAAEMAQFAHAHGLKPQYSEETLEEELTTS